MTRVAVYRTGAEGWIQRIGRRTRRRLGMATYRTKSVRRRLTRAAIFVVLVQVLAVLASPSAQASTLPTGFQDTAVLAGMANPTVVQFASDGRIFVGQKNGAIKVFQSLADTNPVTFADLSSEVDDYPDRPPMAAWYRRAYPA
jgi:hypothetical protein